MNEEIIRVLDYLAEFVLFLPLIFIDKVIIVEINQIIKYPVLEFGNFLQLIEIWLLIIANPGTN